MVTLTPPKRRPALTRLDEELLARLLQQAQTPIEAYTRESALGVPWGSLANSLVGGMLAGRERRRQEEKIKRQDDYADAVTRITSMDTDLMPGQVSISPQGTFETLPTDVEGGGVSTFTRPETYGETLKNYKSSGIAEEQLWEQGIPVEDQLAAQFARDNLNKLTGKRVQGVEATTEAPLGIPYAPQAATVTVGEEFPEDSNVLTRFLSGKEEPVTLDQNANVALSQALRGAGYEPLEYMQYMQNKELQNRTLELAEEERLRNLQPQFKSQKTYYTSTGEPTIVNMFIDPKTGLPLYRGEFNEPIDISPLSPDKPDLGENIEYTLTNEQRAEANDLGFNFPSNATVKFKFKKGFNPEGQSLQNLIANTVSQDWKQPLKDNITKIYTGAVPQTTLNKLSDTITNSFGELAQGASLISSLRDIPVTGGYGEFVDVATGAGALIDGFTGSMLDLEDLLTEKLAGVTTEEFAALRTEMQLYLAASIEAITGEESGRYTAAEQKIAREALASKDMWKGSPGKAYGALMQIMSIQELARDRAEIQLAYEEAKQNNTEFVDPFPYTKENLKIYAQRLKRLGFDARTIKKVIKQSMLGRELIADYYNR